MVVVTPQTLLVTEYQLPILPVYDSAFCVCICVFVSDHSSAFQLLDFLLHSHCPHSGYKSHYVLFYRISKSIYLNLLFFNEKSKYICLLLKCNFCICFLLIIIMLHYFYYIKQITKIRAYCPVCFICEVRNTFFYTITTLMKIYQLSLEKIHTKNYW